MGVDHLGDAGIKQEIGKLWREVRRVAKMTLQNGAIGRAGLRFYEAGSATFEGGGGIIIRDSGYIQIDGDITGIGHFDWEGTFKARGPWELIGLGKVTATTTDWLGDIDMSGDFNLTGDMRVTGAGRVRVGTSLVLNPAGNNGRVEFANGAQVFTDASSIQMYLGNGVAQVSNTEAKLQVGGTTLRVTSGHVFAGGVDTKSVADVPGGFVGALVLIGGEMFRLT